MTDRRRIEFGAVGEAAAVAALKRRGYKILARNVRARFGELDVVAQEGKTLCFVEIKARRSTAFGLPQEAVTRRKQWHLVRLAQWYLKSKRLTGRSARFDVVALLVGRDGRATHVEVIPNAFEVPT